MQKMVCELCGSNDFTKDDHGFFVCDYCRTKYTPEQAKSMVLEGTVRVDRSSEAASLLALANTAMSGGNLQEAFDYANRALEIDHENSNAWCLKGTAAGWMSSPQSPRLREMMHAYALAVDKSSDDSRPAMQQWCAERSVEISGHLTTSSIGYVRQNASTDGVWEAHIALSEEAMTALSTAYQWNPNPAPLRAYVTVASDLIKGVPYRYTVGSQAKAGVRSVAADYRTNLQARVDWAAAQLVRFDPSYVAPKVKPIKSSSCFVVTATTGGENTLPVKTLREFRDAVLLQSGAGRRFVDWYWTHGPTLADHIENSRALRLLSFVLVVAPATVLARVALLASGVRSSHQPRQH